MVPEFKPETILLDVMMPKLDGVETCRRLDVNLRKYLKDVLPKLGDWPAKRVAELTPTAWKAARISRHSPNFTTASSDQSMRG